MNYGLKLPVSEGRCTCYVAELPTISHSRACLDVIGRHVYKGYTIKVFVSFLSTITFDNIDISKVGISRVIYSKVIVHV